MSKVPSITLGQLSARLFAGARFRPVVYTDLYTKKVAGVGIEARQNVHGTRYRPVAYDGQVSPFKTEEEALQICRKLRVEAEELRRNMLANDPGIRSAASWANVYGLDDVLGARNHKPLAIIDVDGVVQDNEHRLHHICEVVDGVERKKKNADWQAYMDAAEGDTPGVLVPLIASMFQKYRVIYLTARVGNPEGARLMVNRLKELDLLNGCAVVMRAPNHKGDNGSYVSATDYKKEFVEYLQSLGMNIAVAVDDSLKNCEMFRAAGIPTLRLYNHLPTHRYSY